MNKILWNPKLDSKNNLEEFKNLINSKYALSLDSYQELYEWSVKNIPDFWNNVINWNYLVKCGTISESDLDLFHISDDVNDSYDYIVKYLEEYKLAGPNF